MKKQSDSLDRKVKLILSKDLGDPDELKADEQSSDEEQGLNTVKEEDISSAEDGTLLKVLNLKSLNFKLKDNNTRIRIRKILSLIMFYFCSAINQTALQRTNLRFARYQF